jgi:prepilin-type N-terminal cleavage/methylation domain-containing protein
VKQAFTLIELLLSISVVAVLMAITMPALNRARLQARVVAVNAELNQIALALEMYMIDNEHNNSRSGQSYPPTRVNCMMQENYYQLPEELVKGKYLPAPRDGSWQGAGMQDRFNRGFSYKYVAVGDLIVNLGTIKQNKLWVPDGFPTWDSVEQGDWYGSPLASPVTWAVYSIGPRFDEYEMKHNHYPVPKQTWYDSKKRKGVIVRMRLKNGRHIGSFQGNP